MKTCRRFKNNKDKPTAQEDPDRMPPFPLGVFINSQMKINGGKTSAIINPNDKMEIKLGGDYYNTFYVNHLNSKNPFTGAQIPEPGINAFLNLRYEF